MVGEMATAMDMLKGPMEREMGGAPGGAIMGAYLSDMMTDMSTFGHAAAVADDSVSDNRAETQEAQQGRALFGSRALLVGTERVDRFDTFHLLADKLGTEVPLMSAVHGVLKGVVDIRDAVGELMSRPERSELG